MNGGRFIIGGHVVVENSNLVVDGEPYEVARTWKERLTSWPWNPLKATRTVIPKTPSPEVYRLPGGILMAHPETAKRMRDLAKANPEYKRGVDYHF